VRSGRGSKSGSANGVVCHLKALERKGLITRGRNMSRAIELVDEPAHLRGLPLAGWVAAGGLRVAEEQKERIDFEEIFNRDNHFVLKVMGDSMIDAQIADGDWVVIQRKHSAQSGDIGGGADGRRRSDAGTVATGSRPPATGE